MTFLKTVRLRRIHTGIKSKAGLKPAFHIKGLRLQRAISALFILPTIVLKRLPPVINRKLYAPFPIKEIMKLISIEQINNKRRKFFNSSSFISNQIYLTAFPIATPICIPNIIEYKETKQIWKLWVLLIAYIRQRDNATFGKVYTLLCLIILKDLFICHYYIERKITDIKSFLDDITSFFRNNISINVINCFLFIHFSLIGKGAKLYQKWGKLYSKNAHAMPR